MPHIADYAAQPPARANNTAAPQTERAHTPLVERKGVEMGDHTTSDSSTVLPRNMDTDTAILNNINILGNMYSQMNDHSSVMNELASESSTEGDNDDVRQQAVSEFTAYHDSLLGVQTVLARLGADKGLANYDRNDDLETMLKNIINTVKNTLSALNILIANIPGIGPVLGPIVYEVKCILDDILNAVENITDGLLNDLEPLLADVIGQATTTACNSGFQLGDLCLVI
ncbi:hypothetical protein BD413DRAFT_464729 [Trametes elegans]|nr:hypothetical protein BD413DRAFT_464729 [Trametes elegans]